MRCPLPLLLFVAVFGFAPSLAEFHLEALVDPDPFPLQVVGDPAVVSVNLRLVLPANRTAEEEGLEAAAFLNVSVTPDVPWKVDFSSPEHPTWSVIVSELIEAGEDGVNVTFEVTGNILGRVRLDVDASYFNLTANEDISRRIRVYHVAFLRRDSKLDEAFTSVLAFMLIINNFNMGCHLDLSIILQILRNPIGPLVGFTSQFVFIPLLAFAVTYLLIESPLYRLGLITLGCSPGGSNSNFWTVIFHGDLSMSLTMTFFSSVAAIGMMPLWLSVLGPALMKQATFDYIIPEIPLARLVLALVALKSPMLLGMILRKIQPSWAAYPEKIIRPFVFFILAFVTTAGVYINLYVFFLWEWNILVSALLIAWAGFTYGVVMSGLVFRLEREQVIAVSIETALQNSGFAIVVLKLSLDHPDADLGALPAVIQLILAAVPLWFVLAFRLGRLAAGRVALGGAADGGESESEDEGAWAEEVFRSSMMERKALLEKSRAGSGRLCACAERDLRDK